MFFSYKKKKKNTQNNKKKRILKVRKIFEQTHHQIRYKEAHEKVFNIINLRGMQIEISKRY